MSKQRFMLTFTEEQIQEPIIYNLGQQFTLITNIRRADVSKDEGWVLLELEGDDNDIEQGIAWVTSKGVRIDPVGVDTEER
jgi:ABC-type methionine transport system ATPase subunit